MCMTNRTVIPLHRMLIYFSLLVLGAVNLSCAKRDQPAPVSELYQGKSFKDFEQQAYAGTSYIVQAGDTLYSIAWYSGSDYRDIAKINKISAPYKIRPGQRLLLTKSSKSIQRKSNKHTGQTSKTIINQRLDPTNKQAYGESEEIVKKDLIGSSIVQFPSRVKRWYWPTSESISRRFSATEEGNKGLDFNGKLGMPIWAAADGKIVYTGDALRGFGKLVIIKHSDAYLTAYAHNDSILVKEQQWIKAGHKIATMGRSGTDKVKLHFEVRYKGKSVDPLRFLPNK